MADNWEGWSPKAGATSQSTVIRLISSAGAGVTGKLATNLTASYLRQGGTRTAISLSDLAAVNSAYSSGGVKEIDATNFAGLYRLDLPDAALATGAEWAVLGVVCSGSIDYMEKMILKSTLVLDVFNSVATLITRLPQTLLFDAAGNIKADLRAILGTVLTETAGQIAAAFIKFFNKASPTGTINSIPDAVAGAASGLALVGSNVGAAASVTGAVGSVTGNVGGNVVGSVGSVVATVSANLIRWLGVAPAILSTSGYVQALLQRWLTDDVAGTPNALESGDVPVGTVTVGDVTLASSQPNYAPATAQQAQDIQDTVDLLIPGAPIEQTIEIGQTNVSVG